MSDQIERTESTGHRRVSHWGIAGLVVSLLALAMAAGMPWIMDAIAPAPPPPPPEAERASLGEFLSDLLEPRQQEDDEPGEEEPSPPQDEDEAADERPSLRALASNLRDRLGRDEAEVSDDDGPKTGFQRLAEVAAEVREKVEVDEDGYTYEFHIGSPPPTLSERAERKTSWRESLWLVPMMVGFLGLLSVGLTEAGSRQGDPRWVRGVTFGTLTITANVLLFWLLMMLIALVVMFAILAAIGAALASGGGG